MENRFEHFVTAQDAVWPQVLSELRDGTKRSHWMWFVFPQIAGLGRSAMSVRYALAGAEAARDYLGHDLLGPRLRQVTDLVLAHEDVPVGAIFGGIDALKFQASMTLFDAAKTDSGNFGYALAVYFRGVRHRRTLELLGG